MGHIEILSNWKGSNVVDEVYYKLIKNNYTIIYKKHVYQNVEKYGLYNNEEF